MHTHANTPIYLLFFTHFFHFAIVIVMRAREQINKLTKACVLIYVSVCVCNDKVSMTRNCVYSIRLLRLPIFARQ